MLLKDALHGVILLGGGIIRRGDKLIKIPLQGNYLRGPEKEHLGSAEKNG